MTQPQPILAVGLTPVWQQIVVLEELVPGGVNRAQEVHWCASGKSINVALALAALGARVTAVAPVGGANGAALAAELTSHGIDAAFIDTAAQTRVCTTIVERRAATSTELVENARPLSAEEIESCARAYFERVDGCGLAVLSGSLAPGAPTDWYARLLARTRCPAILDARGPELLAALEYSPLLVKPNREELGHTVDVDVSTDAGLVAGMRDLCHRGAQWVLVTQGAGAVWLVSRDETWRLTPEQIAPVNPIASGDVLAAGIAWATSLRQAMPEAVRLGVAAAIENALVLLPARIEPGAVRRRAARVELERVSLPR